MSITVTVTITGEPAGLLKSSARALGVTYASMVEELIYRGLMPDRGPTVLKPWGDDNGVGKTTKQGGQQK